MARHGFSFKDRLWLAGKSALSGNIAEAWDNLMMPSDYRGTDGNFFLTVNGVDHYFTYSSNTSAVTAYTKCPPVTAIINKKAQAFINGKTWILNSKGDAKGKEAISPDATKLRKLLSRPNPIQNWKQFEAQAKIYTDLFGYCVIFIIRPIGYKAVIDASALWILPPTILDIKESNDLFYATGNKAGIASISVTYKNTKTPLNLDDIFIIKDIVPSFSTMVLPDSRLKAQEMPINNIIGAYESRNVLIDRRGPQMVISSNKSDDTGNMSLTPQEKSEVQQDFLRYGLRKSQWKQIITSANITVQQLGFPTKDLMLFEEVQDSMMRLCDAYNFPYPLMASDRTNSLGGSNTEPFKKLLYQDAIMPEAETFYQQLNEMFGTDKLGLIIDKDFAHIAALQDDAVKTASARFNRNRALEIEFRYDLITQNRWLELNGEDTRPEGDKYFSDVREMLGNPIQTSTTDSNQQDNNQNLPNNDNQNS